jgi:hypothetical protein
LFHFLEHVLHLVKTAFMNDRDDESLSPELEGFF